MARKPNTLERDAFANPTAGSAKASVRERLVDAAFDLFDERGYEQTTVEHIVERAQAGRTSFFRHYRSKEDVIFPDHEDLLLAIERRLATATDASAAVALRESVRLVLQHYLDEGERARRRYRLTSQVSALRNREIASVARYQRVFREFIAQRAGMGTATELRAEVMAAALVSSHNHVLRRWLRGEAADPMRELDEALAELMHLFGRPLGDAGAVPDGVLPNAVVPSGAVPDGDTTTVLVFRTPKSLDEILPAVRKAIEGP